MAQRVAGNTDHGSARSLSGNEINAGVLKEIQITAQYLPRGLFHVVVVDEADTIPGFFRTSLLKMTDPKDLNAPRNTIWIFTSNEEPEKALGEKLSSRVNRVRFSSQGIAEPSAISFLSRIFSRTKDSERLSLAATSAMLNGCFRER